MGYGRGSTTARGYGASHQKARKALIKQAIGTPCVRCGRIMTNPKQMDLDHTSDRTGYIGFSCSSCNRSAGAKKGNLIRRRRQQRRRSRW